MKLEKKRYEDIIILKFTGEMDSVNLPLLQERVEKLIDSGSVKFIFDVHLLTFANSTSFGYLLSLRRKLADQGGYIALANPSKFMRKALVTFGVEDAFPIFESVEDAILHLVKGAEVGRIALDEAAADEALKGELPVLFRPLTDEGDAPNQVGRIVSLYGDGLLFHYAAKEELDPAALDLAVGTKLKLKFRQPFVAKDHYFEMDGEVKNVRPTDRTDDEGRRLLDIRVVYDKIRDEDRAYLADFVEQQAKWREVVRG
ncbi:MAG: STAS domain-containing protein [Planctomycetota bacterium]